MKYRCSRRERHEVLKTGLLRLCRILFAFICCVSFLSIRWDGSGEVLAGEIRKFTFYTEPDGAHVSVSTADMEVKMLLGKSGTPLSLDLSHLCQTEKIILYFEKKDYDEKTLMLESDYLRRHSRYPENGPLMLESSYRRVYILSNPPEAQIFLSAYSHPQADIFLGTTGEELLINTSGMAEGEQYDIVLRLNYYKEWRDRLSKRALLPGVLNYFPSEKRAIELVPERPILSHLQYWMLRNPLLSFIVIFSGVAGIVYVICGLVIPSIRRISALKKQMASWKALADKVNRDDPRFGLRLGNYRIVEKIGKGGMAEVYKAVSESTLSERDCVAVKLIHADMMDEPEFRSRFIREIRISSDLHHPNILHVLDFGEREGLLYIVMEYVKGVTLKKIVPESGMSLDEFAEIFGQILDAVQFAHQKGIIHRDLKPDNIMVTENKRIVVMDFGLARCQGASTITVSGTTFGTPVYMAPEQVQSGNQDERTDQYSLGIVAFEMLTGQIPFYDEITINIMLKHVTEKPPSLRQFRCALPQQIEEIVLKMLEKDPAHRFSSLNQIKESLENAVPVIAMRADGKE